MARKTHHVVPSPDGGWDIKRGGAERASGHFDSDSILKKEGKKPGGKL